MPHKDIKKRKKYHREYQKKHKEKLNKISRDYYYKNKLKKDFIKKRLEYGLMYREYKKTDEYKIKRNIAIKLKRKNDVNYKISMILRSRIYKALKRNTKTGSAIRDLGCSIEELKKYLESKFKEGMTWENHGEWHIDHIEPLCNFNLSDYTELKKACNYTNLQPLWANENMSKNRYTNHIPFPSQELLQEEYEKETS